MFKIEVVAKTAEDMAAELSALADIYKEGGRFLKNYEKAKSAPVEAQVESEEAETEEAPKRRGRKAKSKEPEVEVVETETVETPKEKEPEPEAVEKPLTLDDVREAMKKYIDAAAVKSGKEETRRVEFKAMLDKFDVPKLSALDEAFWPQMIDLANAKLAEIED